MTGTTKPRPHLLRRLLRAPAAHFVALGAVAFVVLHPRAQPRELAAAPAEEIVVGAADLLGRSLDDFVEEEVLVREALALGLDRGERVVQARLTDIGRFLGLEGDEGVASVEDEARALDLQRRDPVVRRHLATLMRMYLSRLAPSEFPTEAELQQFLTAHAGDFAAPPRVRLAHVHLSRDRRGPSLPADAARLRRRLVEGDTPPGAAAALGDPFARGSQIVASASEIDGIFGPGFAAAVETLAPRTWSEPIASTYGLHLVWVYERFPAFEPPLEEVRSRVLHRLLRDRREERLADRVAALRARYTVRLTAGG